MSYIFTDAGKAKAESYINELEAKKKEILDAGLDTCDDTNIPGLSDILADVNDFDVDEDGEYYNGWGVTDHYDSDGPLCLKLGEDIISE